MTEALQIRKESTHGIESEDELEQEVETRTEDGAEAGAEQRSPSFVDGEENASESEMYDVDVPRMLIGYNDSIKEQNRQLKEIERLSELKLNIEHCLHLLKIYNKAEKVLNNNSRKREFIMREINKGLKMSFADQEFQDSRLDHDHLPMTSDNGRESKGRHRRPSRGVHTGSKNSLLFDKKYQRLSIEHGLLEGDFNELRRKYESLEAKYQLLLHNKGGSDPPSRAPAVHNDSTQISLKNIKIGGKKLSPGKKIVL